MAMLEIFIENIVPVAFGAVSGLLIAIIANRRSTFTYKVFHNQIGISAEDEAYGSVKVTLHDQPVQRLWLSTVELANKSIRDFTDVGVHIFSVNTRLLSEKTAIVGTMKGVEYTEEHKKKLDLLKGENPDEPTIKHVTTQRNYFVSTMNRGQILRFEFLNTPTHGKEPIINLDVQCKGVKCKFINAEDHFLGLRSSTVMWLGVFIGLAVVIYMTLHFSFLWVSILSFFLGLFAHVYGLYAAKLFRKVRDMVTG